MHAAKTSLCDLCPFVGTISQLKGHKKQVHAPKDITCKMCDYKCSDKFYMKEHILAKHTPDHEKPR